MTALSIIGIVILVGTIAVGLVVFGIYLGLALFIKSLIDHL